uniref:Regulatory factor X associated protein n=1 Tax=Pelusios castaneus TaxID=367368 RepID=A0A8C8SHP7_9SAUR
MQPCGGDEEAAAGLAPAPSAPGGLMFLCELGPSEGEADAAEEGEAAGGESTVSPEELEDEEAAMASGGEAPAGGGGCKSCTYEGCSETTTQDCIESSVSVTKQRTGSIGDRPTRPTLLEQVLNQKRLSLLRSPEVVQFLQKQQQLLSQQALEQRQQQFPGAPV